MMALLRPICDAMTGILIQLIKTPIQLDLSSDNNQQ